MKILLKYQNDIKLVLMPQLDAFKKPNVLAHRMLVMGFPENTVLSLNQAIKLGVDWVEFDVKVLTDGTLVSMHDRTADRTTDGHGDITQMNYTQVKQLNAGKGYNFGFIPIPKVEEILQELSKSPYPIKAEMHIHNLWEPEPLVKLLDKYNMRDRCYFNLNVVATAEYMRRDLQDSKSLISLNVDSESSELKDICNDLDISYLCIPPKSLNTDFINRIHNYRSKKPVFVHCYPVQNERDWQKMIDFGVDVIQTDYPEALMEYLSEKFK